MSHYPTNNYDRQSHMNRETKYTRNGYPSNIAQPDPRTPRGYSSHNSLRTINRYPPSAQFITPYPPQQRSPQYKQPTYTRSGYPTHVGHPIIQMPYPPSHPYPQKTLEGPESNPNPTNNGFNQETVYKNSGALREHAYAPVQGTHDKPDTTPLSENLQEDEERNLMNSKKTEIEKSDDSEKPIKKRKGVWPCCCCPGCCSRKVCVITTFLICILVGVVIWLLYPKVPSSSIESIQLSGSPQVNNEQLPYFFNATLLIRVSMNNYNLIPISLSRLEAVGYDSNTNSEIGKGIAEHVSLPGQRVTSFEFPYVLTYFFGNVSDPTWVHLARSCVPTLVNFPDRSAMAVRFMASMWFPILSWTGWVPKVTYQGNFVCPEP